MVVEFQEFDKTSFPLVIYAPSRVTCFEIAIILSYMLVFIVSDYGICVCHMPRYMAAANEIELKQTRFIYIYIYIYICFICIHRFSPASFLWVYNIPIKKKQVKSDECI